MKCGTGPVIFSKPQPLFVFTRNTESGDSRATTEVSYFAELTCLHPPATARPAAPPQAVLSSSENISMRRKLHLPPRRLLVGEKRRKET